MKQVQSDKFFTEDEQERIRKAVQAAEATTSGEIATMIVAESDPYREAELIGVLLSAATVALVIAVATAHVTIWSYLPMVVALYLFFRLLFPVLPRLKLRFTTAARISEAVRLRAVRGFYEKELYRTRHETGILIFMSLLEHKVWILGDRGINERIDPGSWHEMAGDLARGIAEGRGADALCSIIGRCGVELSRHFPRQFDDINELGDSLITLKDKDAFG